MKKKALGRGLGALIPEVKSVEAPRTTEVKSAEAPRTTNEIDIDLIEPNPCQPRFDFEEEPLYELTENVKKNGILVPILVRPYGERFQLVAGERRLMAAHHAGLLKIPARVLEIPDNQMRELALVENIQREQLNPMEEAQAYNSLMEETGETQEQISERLGKDRSTIANSMRLLKLPATVSLLVSKKRLSPGHARALLSSGSAPAEMLKLAETIIEKGWSVRETERYVKNRQIKNLPRPPKSQDPNEEFAVSRLRVALGTKVEIVTKVKNSGEIRIHFFSHEDLIRIFDIIAITEKN